MNLLCFLFSFQCTQKKIEINQHSKTTLEFTRKKNTKFFFFFANYLHRSNRDVHIQIVEDDLFVWIIWASIILVASPNFNSSHDKNGFYVTSVAYGLLKNELLYLFCYFSTIFIIKPHTKWFLVWQKKKKSFVSFARLWF